MGGPLYVYAERFISKSKWFTDPVCLFPRHLVGSIFGVLIMAFFAQSSFAVASGNAALPNGLIFRGGYTAIVRLEIEAFGISVVMIGVFLLSYVTISVISKAMGCILTYYK